MKGRGRKGGCSEGGSRGVGGRAGVEGGWLGFASKKGVIDMVGVASSAILACLPPSPPLSSLSRTPFPRSFILRSRPGHPCVPLVSSDIRAIPTGLTCPADALGHPFRPTPATSSVGPGGCLSPWRPDPPRPTPVGQTPVPVSRYTLPSSFLRCLFALLESSTIPDFSVLPSIIPLLDPILRLLRRLHRSLRYVSSPRSAVGSFQRVS